MFDVVIPYHGRYDWLSVCLTALARMSSNPLRVILVDNASPPDGQCVLGTSGRAALASEGAVADSKLAVLIRSLTDLNPAMSIERVRLGENRSFSHSVNAGVAAGANKYVCVLNSDVVVTPGWDAKLLTHLASEAVGLVGPRTNYAIGLQGGGYQTAMAPPFLVFFCVAFRRDVWDKVGPLDAETFGDWCGGEDLDYSWRVREHGYALAVADFEVYHAGSQTYSTQVQAEVQNAMHARAELRLKTKWGEESYKALRALPNDLSIGIGVLMIDRRIDYVYFRSMFDMLAHYSTSRGPGAGRRIKWCDVSRMSPGMARNVIAQWALDAGVEYLLMVDDDMAFPPHFLSRLIDHQKDVVAALAYKRVPPHESVAYVWHNDGEGFSCPQGIEHTGLRKVDGVGFGGVLIKTDVLRRMRKPYFEFNAKFGEDLGFCKKAADEARAEIYVDTDLIMTHMGYPLEVDEAYVKAWRAAQEQRKAAAAVELVRA